MASFWADVRDDADPETNLPDEYTLRQWKEGKAKTVLPISASMLCVIGLSLTRRHIFSGDRFGSEYTFGVL